MIAGDSTKDQYLVIGAGPVGLAMAKSLKLAHIPYQQAEADDDVGGNWYHGVYATANILSSRTATEYPDFPMPQDYPDFPSAAQMYAYYKLYTDHYGLWENILFNTKVVSVTPSENDRWAVAFGDGTVKLYKGVMVCNGHHWSKNYPVYDGSFEGESFHSKEYKSPEQLRGKRVLVIGAGNSAFDISSECARVSKKCFMSVRRGIWIFPKTFMGKPLSAFQSKILPNWFKMRMAKVMLKLAVGDPREYGFPKPTIQPDERHPTINTDTLINIKNGKIKVKPAVKCLERTGVRFTDGSFEEIDTIVYATGFKVDFPFLPPALHRVEKSHVKVYAYSMFDDYKGLYIIGWFQPRGGVGSLVGPYADLLAQMLKVQDRFRVPLGSVMKEMGEKIPGTHLFGSVEFLKWIRKKNKQLSRMERTGLRLDAKNPGFSNIPLKKESMTGIGPVF